MQLPPHSPIGETTDAAGLTIAHVSIYDLPHRTEDKIQREGRRGLWLIMPESSSNDFESTAMPWNKSESCLKNAGNRMA